MDKMVKGVKGEEMKRLKIFARCISAFAPNELWQMKNSLKNCIIMDQIVLRVKGEEVKGVKEFASSPSAQALHIKPFTPSPLHPFTINP